MNIIDRSRVAEFLHEAFDAYRSHPRKVTGNAVVRVNREFVRSKSERCKYHRARGETAQQDRCEGARAVYREINCRSAAREPNCR